MTAAQFRRLADAHKLSGRVRDAIRLIEVKGLTAYAAAQEVGVDQAAISRARKRFARELCPRCRQPIPK